MAPKVVGIMGGSGLYEIEGLEKIREEQVSTPFGDPSDTYIIGELNGTTLVFLPRHGKGHRIGPSEINYCANIFGMKKLGVEYLLSMSAVGSLKEEIPPGDIVVVDQFIDRTKGVRRSTFFGGGLVAHVSFGDPVCPDFFKVAHNASEKITERVHKGGTYLCMEGPQFSTRAESRLYRTWGADVIGMTNLPEAKLAREAGLCYASVAFSTDYDSWRESDEAVTSDEIMATIQKNVNMAKQIVKTIATMIPDKRSCGCKEAMKYSFVTDRKMIPEKLKQDLKPLIGEFL